MAEHRGRRTTPRNRAVRTGWLVFAALAVVVLLAGAWIARPIEARFVTEAADVRVAFEPVAAGLAQPVHASPVPGSDGRVFVAEKAGSIYMIEPGADPTPVLDLQDAVLDDGWERGFYSLAFDPDYASNGFVYVAYTARGDGAAEGRIVVERVRSMSTPSTTAETRLEILSVPKLPDIGGGTDAAHNGGALAFGPRDGFLYVSIGDGRRPRVTDLGAQDLASLRGSILRIDVSDARLAAPYAVPRDNPFVDRRDARPEIWAYGFRNPWRMAFHPDGAALLVSDVGQHRAEEVALVRRGENHGWPIREARTWSLKANVKAMGITKETWNRPAFVARSIAAYARAVTVPSRVPVVDYGHQDVDPLGGQAVVGGFVYEGDVIPELHGRYLFADFINGRLWSLELRPDGLNVRRELIDSDMAISSITKDADGEVLVTDYASGRVVRLVRQDDVAASP